jgi:hypothetical protein
VTVRSRRVVACDWFYDGTDKRTEEPAQRNSTSSPPISDK